MHPREIWEKSGRWATMGDEMFRLKDRKEADLALGMTHEGDLRLPAAEAQLRQVSLCLVQFQSKFRDEARPKSGLLRVREFRDEGLLLLRSRRNSGLDHSFDRHFEAYRRMFKRFGPEIVAVGPRRIDGRQHVDRVHAPDRRRRRLGRGLRRLRYTANVEYLRFVSRSLVADVGE